MVAWQTEEVRLCIMTNYKVSSISIQHSFTLETLTDQEIPRIF